MANLQQPVAAVISDDPAAASDGMQCTDHPYRRSNPGGICAFCLQEKLGKLVSSSITSTPFATAASTTSANAASSSSSPSPRPSSFLKPTPSLKRSKSVAPASAAAAAAASLTSDSPRKKSFWSFLYHSKNQTKSSSSYDQEPPPVVMVETPVAASRKVARSRSVGCGSRSFSGDFLERISTGFGDCTLRRVESHREPNNKVVVMEETARMKERVKCGGIFGGFGMISTSASSSYWLAAAAAGGEDFDAGKSSRRNGGGRRSWAWAFASPMRAFRPANASTSSSSSLRSNNAISSINAVNSLSKMNNANGNGKAKPALLAVGS